MEDWKELMRGKPFITDLGEEKTATVEGEEQTLGRYAVWSPMRQSESHCIVEVGSDLGVLTRKYKIPQERVCFIQK